MSDLQTILIQVSGPDRPGISAGVLGVLDSVGASVLDIEQIVIRGRLTLGMLIAVPPNQDVLKELLLFGWENELAVDFEVVAEESTEPSLLHVVTALGPELTPGELRSVTEAIAEGEGNIDRIERLSKYPIMSYEFRVTDGDEAVMRDRLIAAAADHSGLDVAIQREGLRRRAKRLVVMDVDSTLIQNEVIELLADETGHGAEVKAITDRAMAGELDFAESLHQRVALLAGLDSAAIDRAWERLELTPGARTFMRTLK
ncbi:MAG: ACT domain-containing protein, partial [Deltaproteobacteria bacterium]|nr:ACT domain-containing protein [Deltaproteobacteria bacterium]